MLPVMVGSGSGVLGISISFFRLRLAEVGRPDNATAAPNAESSSNICDFLRKSGDVLGSAGRGEEAASSWLVRHTGLSTGDGSVNVSLRQEGRPHG